MPACAGSLALGTGATYGTADGVVVAGITIVVWGAGTPSGFIFGSVSNLAFLVTGFSSAIGDDDFLLPSTGILAANA